MPITVAQNVAIKEVIQIILSQTTGRGRRQLAAMFMDLVDRQEWPQYFEVIPEPRCLKNIQAGVEKGRYKESTDVYTDLSLVFWNALFYNEPKSGISLDAETLKSVLETEWKKRPVLPAPRASPPPSSAQKVHGTAENEPSKSLAKEVLVAKSAPPNSAKSTTIPGHTMIQVPTPGGSTSKPVPIRPKSAQHTSSPDIEVDVVSPDEEGQEDGGAAFHPERDPLSEEIVKQLEKGLPRWPGLGEEGWMADIKPERNSDIVQIIKTYKDFVGNRVAVCLESLPEESLPTLHLSSTASVSLKQVETRVRHKLYKTAKEFDIDMSRLFEKARRWHEPGSEPYGKALLLQRLYQAITGNNPPTPPYISSTNFAALRAGPGNVKPVHGTDGDGAPNVTTHRVLTRDRVFVEELDYKGWKIKVADWVHLANPDDPSRPIIGQVFRCWLSDGLCGSLGLCDCSPTDWHMSDRNGLPHVTVSWYYRPEQTFHTSNREFWENEIFKTSHFADHPVEDIIEKIACQFTARHIRGRPRPPYWYMGFPLYVCDSRYNDRDRVFVRIKNWNSCVPEEVRQNTEFMPIYPFERIVYPPRMPSPFLVKGTGKSAAIKGPGGILSASDVPEGPGPGESDQRKRVSNPVTATPVRPTVAAGFGYGTLQAPAPSLQQSARRTPVPDKSIITAAGGSAAVGGSSQIDKLGAETAKLFDRDPETNEVLWFAAPPLNQPRARGPRHSLAYLQFIAAKRKTRSGESELDGVMVVDGQAGSNWNDGASTKRARMAVAPTVMETMQEVWREMSADG